jgi:hypothetical protein
MVKLYICNPNRDGLYERAGAERWMRMQPAKMVTTGENKSCDVYEVEYDKIYIYTSRYEVDGVEVYSVEEVKCIRTKYESDPWYVDPRCFPGRVKRSELLVTKVKGNEIMKLLGLVDYYEV